MNRCTIRTILLCWARRSTPDSDARRSEVETALRTYYGAVSAGWDSEAEARVRARVARELAAARRAGGQPRRSLPVKATFGPHLAAVVCAVAAIFTFGTQLNLGGSGVPGPATPATAPVKGHHARVNGPTRLSSGEESLGAVELAL
jgi:hypothetical protein